MKKSTKTVMASEENLFSIDGSESEEDDDLVFSGTILGSGKSARPPSKMLFRLSVLSSIGGFLFGYDTGVVSGAMILVRKVRLCQERTWYWES